jgi:N-acetylmuramic acid 6-phosphate etherase
MSEQRAENAKPAASVADRSHIATEKRNPRTKHLHTLPVRECVDLINQEDREIHHAMKRAAKAISKFIEAAERGFLAGGRLVYVGAGTSGRLGVLDASEAPPTFQVEPGRIVGIIAGGDSSLRKSSEGKEDDPRGAWADLDALNLTNKDAVLAIAAGGTTPYALGALEFCKQGSRSPEQRPLTAMLVCTQIDQPASADHLIVLKTGPEVLTGSTRMKAGTATKLALNTISTTLMVRSGRVYENLMVDVRATNAKLRDRAARIVATLTGLSRGACFELLERAGGAVKAAVVMQRLSLDRGAAEERLRASDGRLERALGE